MCVDVGGIGTPHCPTIYQYVYMCMRDLFISEPNRSRNISIVFESEYSSLTSCPHSLVYNLVTYSITNTTTEPHRYDDTIKVAPGGPHGLPFRSPECLGQVTDALHGIIRYPSQPSEAKHGGCSSRQWPLGHCQLVLRLYRLNLIWIIPARRTTAAS
jgi:hypothetical protein